MKQKRSAPKNNRTYMSKTKLPTASRTKKHRCSQCQRTDAKLHYISIKEKRWLCEQCLNKNKNRDRKEKPNYTRASKMNSGWLE